MSEQSENQKNGSVSSDALLSLLGNLMGSAPSPPPQPQPQAQAQSSQANTSAPGADLIGSLLSNPEIISKLPQMLSMLKPLMNGASAAGTEQKNETAAPAALISNSTGQKSQRGMDDRTALLYAMKPYLKQERREAIDYMVKLSKLGDILKSL